MSDHPPTGAKSFVVKFKVDGLADGEFMGYASVFGNKDSYGDVVIKGAFTNTIAEWERKGVPIPLLWGHNTADPDFNLGHIISAVEDDRGLKVHGKLDMESPKAAQTYRLLKSGRVNQMSFAYSVRDGAYVETDGASGRDSYYELRELDLFEVSIVPIGANQETEILAVKALASSLRAKVGRTLSAANEKAMRDVVDQLKSAVGAIEDVLSAAAGDSGAKDQEPTSGAAEPPPEADVKSPPSGVATPKPSVVLALAQIESLS